ncbi:MAG: hypothetical protein AAF726_11430 [Planctomycetota bacterium]
MKRGHLSAAWDVDDEVCLSVLKHLACGCLDSPASPPPTIDAHFLPGKHEATPTAIERFAGAPSEDLFPDIFRAQIRTRVRSSVASTKCMARPVEREGALGKGDVIAPRMRAAGNHTMTFDRLEWRYGHSDRCMRDRSESCAYEAFNRS